MTSRAKILVLLDDLKSSYWFLPTLMAITTAIISQVILVVDRRVVGPDSLGFYVLYTGSAEGARSVLSTIASSMIGIAGVVFSITMVTLTLASKQFGPRLLRNFMQDRGNQVVLGTFVSTFLYCLFILRQVHGEDESDIDKFIPQFSILGAVVLAVASLGVLIYFIHHTAAAIQTPMVIDEVAHELQKGIKTLYPSEMGRSYDSHASGEMSDVQLKDEVEVRTKAESMLIPSNRSGYVRRIDSKLILEVADQNDLLIWTERRPGDFVIEGDPVFQVWPAIRLNDEIHKTLRGSFTVGQERTQEQDVRFAIEQLVGIALLALSPSVNDPFTAIQCVDRLGGALSFMTARRIPSPIQCKQGRPRVITPVIDFPELMHLAFTQIRQNATSQPSVLESLLGAFAIIAAHAEREGDKHCIKVHAGMTYELAKKQVSEPWDLRRIEGRYRHVQKTLRSTSQVHEMTLSMLETTH